MNILPNPAINNGCPLTEIFSLMKRYEKAGDEITLDFNSTNLKLISTHSEQSIEILLRGLRIFGQLIGALESQGHLEDIGDFISILSNLIEELYNLGSDSRYSLKILEGK